jgi:hypothetical protein
MLKMQRALRRQPQEARLRQLPQQEEQTDEN